MPLKIDTIQKLLNYAESRGVRPMREGETLGEYREFCAQRIEPQDPVEAMELRLGKGWDEVDPVVALAHMIGSKIK